VYTYLPDKLYYQGLVAGAVNVNNSYPLTYPPFAVAIKLSFSDSYAFTN